MEDDSSDSSFESDFRKRIKRSNDEVDYAVANLAITIQQTIVSEVIAKGRVKVDHRLLPRQERVKMEHREALRNTKRDYTGPIPTFRGREFDTMFRISRSRFQRLLEDFGRADIPFFSGACQRTEKERRALRCTVVCCFP